MEQVKTQATKAVGRLYPLRRTSECLTYNAQFLLLRRRLTLCYDINGSNLLVLNGGRGRVG